MNSVVLEIHYNSSKFLVITCPVLVSSCQLLTNYHYQGNRINLFSSHQKPPQWYLWEIQTWWKQLFQAANKWSYCYSKVLINEISSCSLASSSSWPNPLYKLLRKSSRTFHQYRLILLIVLCLPLCWGFRDHILSRQINLQQFMRCFNNIHIIIFYIINYCRI